MFDLWNEEVDGDADHAKSNDQHEKKSTVLELGQGLWWLGLVGRVEIMVPHAGLPSSRHGTRFTRHSDYRTTLEHYTVLGLADTAAAMDQVTSIGKPDQGNLATGTIDERAAVETAVETAAAARTGASRCKTVRKQDEPSRDPGEGKSLSFASQRHCVQPGATAGVKRGKGIGPSAFSLGSGLRQPGIASLASPVLSVYARVGFVVRRRVVTTLAEPSGQDATSVPSCLVVGAGVAQRLEVEDLESPLLDPVFGEGFDF